MCLRCYLYMLTCVLCLMTCGSTNSEEHDIIEELLDGQHTQYDHRVRPGADNDEPVVVLIDIYINDISSVSEMHMEYGLNLYLRQIWIDPRLANPHLNRTVTLNYNQYERLWVPDTFFVNEKDGHSHKITVPNRLIRLSPDGTVLFSQRISLTLACMMRLEKYPLDNQTCYIKVESFGYTTSELQLRWDEREGVISNEELQLPEFTLSKIELGNCTYTSELTGSFSCMSAALHLDREYEFYITQTYIPSILIVILSWVSFWIDLKAVPARISLGLITVLTTTTQSTGISQKLPHVSYTKAIDVWMATCLVFVFGGMVEYSIVNVLARTTDKKSKRSKKKGKNSTGVGNSKIADPNTTAGMNPKGEHIIPPANGQVDVEEEGIDQEPDTLMDKLKRRWHGNKAQSVDDISKVLFPAAFIVFNFFYWICYLHVVST